MCKKMKEKRKKKEMIFPCYKNLIYVGSENLNHFKNIVTGMDT